MLFAIIGITIGGVILFIVHKLTSTSLITSTDIKIKPSEKKVTKRVVKTRQEIKADEEYVFAFELLKKACNYDNRNEYVSRTTRRMTAHTFIEDHVVMTDNYSTGSDIDVNDDIPCTPFIECYNSISSDGYTSPKSANSESVTNTSIGVPTLEHNDTYIFREDELSKIVKLEIENNRIIKNKKEIEIKKRCETKRKEELKKENKIIKNKEELSQCINNKLESESKVIITKSILDKYLNEKLEAEQKKIKDKYNQIQKANNDKIPSVKSDIYNYKVIWNILNYSASNLIQIVIIIYNAIRILLLKLDVWQYRRSKEMHLKIQQAIIEIQALRVENSRLDVEYRNWFLL